MTSFKKRWEITNNWQLIFPFLGIISLLYTAYFFSKNLIRLYVDRHELRITYYALVAVAVIVSFYVMLRFFLWCFKKLENKWKINYRWEMIAIFIAFALTGSSSVRIAKPLLEFVGFSKSIFPEGFLGAIFYWIIRILIILPIYQILLIIFGALVGQFKFFLEFEKKMLKRMRIIK
jgi:hypothetical protein